MRAFGLPARATHNSPPSPPTQGLGAGFVAVCVGSPVDVVKSRIMGDKTVRLFGASCADVSALTQAAPGSSAARAQKQYSGMVDCFRKTYVNEGIFAFYKGFLPNFARLGSWNVVMFLSLEKVRKLYLDTVQH